MAVQTEPSLLDYLHDARCRSWEWDCRGPLVRRMHLVAEVDDECDYEPWRGKTIGITLLDAVACRFIGWGYQTGAETIDAYRSGVSPELERECARLQSVGIEVPPLMFTIVFASGSTIEVACREVLAEPVASTSPPQVASSCRR